MSQMTKASKLLSYGEFQGSAEISIEDNCLFGQVLHIDDLITYEANSPQELEEAFKGAIEEYLLFCNEEGHAPCRPYKGVFNVRVSPDLHRKAAFLAKNRNASLNEIVNEALTEKINAAGKTATQVIHNHRYFITLKEQEAYNLEDATGWPEGVQKPALRTRMQ
jgi:predicted HicB family RNase H-like nuclease